MSCENGEAQNDTLSESEKMDISEVSDQVSPVSDQSGCENVDNLTPKQPSPQEHASLDNASAAATTTTTTTAVANPTRDRLDSALSLEGFDLELPTLDSYQEEYVDFPSSPKQLKECLEAHGLAMPLERDSGTMGRSEEEDDEDTSIYQAVLSPDCQDVRLKKDDVEPNKDLNREKTEIQDCEASENKQSNNLRRLLTPNPEDTLFPDLYGNRGTIQVISDTVFESPTNITKAASSHDLKILGSQHSNMKTKSKSTVDLRHDDNAIKDSNFIFERRNSKRLGKKDFGGRVMEGLFVESPLLKDETSATKSGLRKITLSHSLQMMESPISDDSPVANNVSEVQSEEFSNLSFEGRLNELNSQDMKNKVMTAAEVHRGESEEPGRPRPVPKVRTLPLTKTTSTPSSMKNPPCPKPRRKLKNVVSADSPSVNDRDPGVLLDPRALDNCIPNRGAQIVNPDGSVEVREERPGSLVAPQRGGRRRIRVSADILTSGSCGDTTADGDESSGDSRLSDTDMMSPDDDPDLDALLSPDLDTPDEMEDSIMERLGEPPPEPVPIPELTAAEERAEARSWRSVVVAGLERRIDMKVIEPYKRVLSHGGYLSAGSHNAIIVFSACFLPDRSRVDYDYVMDNLFLYVLTTLDQLITEDYVLIYLHGATSRSCMPTFSWLKRCYQMIDRRLRKNLKRLYLVHPTFWLKTIVIMTRPFISSKFSRKLNFVDNLAELADIVPLEQASIPDRVKQYDQIRQSLEQAN